MVFFFVVACSPSDFSRSDVWFNLALKQSECGFIFLLSLKYHMFHIHLFNGYIFLKSTIWHKVCSPEKLRANCGMQLLAALFIVFNLGWFYSWMHCIWQCFISVHIWDHFLDINSATQLHSKIENEMIFGIRLNGVKENMCDSLKYNQSVTIGGNFVRSFCN